MIVLLETGTAYPSRAPVFISCFFLWGPFCPSFKFSVMGVLFVCFVCLRPVSHVPNVTCVSRLSILDSPSGFSNVYKLSMTYFSKLIHDFNYIVVFSNIHVNQFFLCFLYYIVILTIHPHYN